MKRKTLSYYPKFQCIADKCRHSCCLGWEIDIDPDTREHYATLKDPYAKTINDNIEDDPEPHFRLTSDERCPFLNSRGLCDMILNIGEEHLCNICRDHPRYRNNGEIGLGICCEEALRLLIEETDPITEIEVEDDYCDDDDELVFEYEVQRKELFDILNSDADFEEKINRCSDYMGCGLEFAPDWSKKLLWDSVVSDYVEGNIIVGKKRIYLYGDRIIVSLNAKDGVYAIVWFAIKFLYFALAFNNKSNGNTLYTTS